MGILFLCCDMGETNALIPVMQELQLKKEDFKILAMGAAISKLNKSEFKLSDKVIELKEPVDTVKNRAKSLENISKAVQDLNPTLVVSGAASKAQEQLIEALGAKSIVYLDNFNYAMTNPSFETVKGVAGVGKKIITASDIVKEQISSCIDLTGKKVKSLGRPSLESWVDQVQKTNKAEVVHKVKFDGEKPIVTIIGGYGPRYDEGVNEAYKQATKELVAAEYQVHMQHHPNVVENQPLTTIEAVGMADYVVCYDSTVGFEALFAGKKVVYLQPENVEPYDNIAIEKGLAAKVKTNEDLLEALKMSSKEKKDPYQVLGVKRESTEAIASYILKKAHKK